MKKSILRSLLPTALSILGFASTASAQFQWNSYNTSGALVQANVATGGDLNSGSVTFTIPANTQLSFVTKSFTPFSLATGNSRKLVTFSVSASGGLGGVGQRTMGWGLYNSAGTAGFTDDVGYFGLWNGGGPYIECYSHASGGANLLSGSALGQGTVNSGPPVNGVTYTNQIQLVMNAAATGISLGTSSSTLAAAGLAMNGPSVTQRVYTNPVNGPLGGVTSFDEFAFMFNNTTASPVTVTLSAIALGNTMTWDASGANPATPTDGAGNWSSTNANWSSVAADNIWSAGYNAVFGATNGAAGAITIAETTGVTVSNITFNAASSGNYSVGGNPLNFVGNTITVNSGVNATISSLITGKSFTKEGPGTLTMGQAANNTFTGDVVVNNGVLVPGGTAGRLYIPNNLIINTNGTFNAVSGGPGSGTFGTATLVLNGRHPGGSNVWVNSGAWISASTLVLANDAVITNGGGTVSGTYAVTNTDARAGQVWLTRHGFGVFNTIAKSTPGTVIISTRPNTSATDGFIATVNAGALIFDYAYTGNAGSKLKVNSPLTFQGGALVFSNNSPVSPSTVNPGTGGTFFNSGASSLYFTNAGSGGGNVTLGPLTRKAGATFNFFKSGGPGAIGSSSANVNGIVGGWHTYNLTDWTMGTSTWVPYTSYTTSADPTTWAAANNVSLNGNTSPNVPDVTAINTLRLTAASTVTLDGSLTLSSGGLLVTGSGATAITGGSLLGASGADLIVHQYASADLTVSSTLADNTSATSLTKDGVGKLIISGVNNMTGTNFLNGGTVEVSDLAQLASGPLDMNGGALRYTGSDTTSSRTVATRGLGPIFDIVGGTRVTQSGAITGSGEVLGDFGGLTKTGNGTLILSANNNYNGETIVNGGVLAINGTNACNASVWDAGRVTVFATLGGNGVVSGPVSIKSGGTIAPGNSIGTLTLANGLTLESGSTCLFEVTNGAAGDLLAVQGNLSIQPNTTIAISVLGTPLEPTTNVLITYTGTKYGSFNPIVSVTGSLNASVTVDESTPGQIKLAVIPQVAITVQPVNGLASVGATATFNVTATGNAPLSYQWFYYGNNVNNTPTGVLDQTNALLSLPNAQSSDSGYYQVVVSNAYNAVSSAIVLLIVGDVAPIISGPTNKVVIQGNNVTFNTTVQIANPPPAFQWQTNGTDVPGASSSSVTFNNVQFDLDNLVVSVIATNVAGSATNSAILNVVVLPSITLQPTNITVNAGSTAVFTASAAGVPTPSLQWYRNGVLLAGQTSGTLTIPNAQGGNIGNYTVVASNIVGVAASSVAKLTVVSTGLSTTTIGPANNATAVCYDTPLYLTFSGPVSTVNSGAIRIYNANNQVTPVDVIDMGSNTVIISSGIGLTNNVQPHSLFSGDAQVMNYFPVIVSGNRAAIYPHLGVMTSNQTYYVTVDSGVVVDSAGAYFAGISDTNAWRFTTKVAGPSNPTNIVVAVDGSGDFVTVQGAIDSIAPGNTTPILINVRDGNYVEIVDISGKNNITFRGQSRKGTVIGYPNNNNLTGTTAGRMAFKVNSADIKLENLTLTNGTPQGGSQAECLLVYNSGLRCVVVNCDIISKQDTILINAGASQGYFQNCRVVGNFDYIWGSGTGFFTNCVFRTITNTLSGTYNLTAARTTTSGALSTTTPWVNPNGTTYSANGFSFVNCTLEADPGLVNITLAASNGTAGGQDSWINCRIDPTAYQKPSDTLTNIYVFWQFGNSNLLGTAPVVYPNIATLTNGDSRMTAALSVSNWFYGWTPQLDLTIDTQPTNQTVNVSNTVSFVVVAAGVPAPTYQWTKNGTNVPGATGATLTINNVQFSDVGTYAVLVTSAGNTLTSDNATLTVPNRNPVANPTTYSRNAGFNLKIAISSLGWLEPDGDPISITGISSTNGATVTYDAAFIYYTNPNDVADRIDYSLSDGQGGIASSVINVVITPPSTNQTVNIVSQTVNGDGSISLKFVGIPNYSYWVEATTNIALPLWLPISTNIAGPNGVWLFTDTDATNYPQRYYRSHKP